MSSKNSTTRFSSRVENYIKYRPGYPQAVVDLLNARCGLTSASAIADVGSGTGILTELLLRSGNKVFAVEPNRDMREAAERLLRQYPNFISVDGTAEATNLKDASVNLIVAGQAFHWFERSKTRREFLRVLKPGGWVALIWNDRNTTATPFLKAYEALLQTYATDYAAVDHKQIDTAVIASFFGAGKFEQASFPNEQVFDFEGVKGRLESSSYAPEAGHPKHDPMLKTLCAIFENYQSGGKIAFEYSTLVYFGQMLA
jgi:ubiquinone/menaquinone biosynthesis C-methylase UbiE